MSYVDLPQGLISVTVSTQWGPNSGNNTEGHSRPLNGTVRHNITSVTSGNATVTRTFVIAKYELATEEVDTIAGVPASSLTSICEFQDAQPSQEAKVIKPSSVR